MNKYTKVSLFVLLIGIIAPWVAIYRYGLNHVGDLLFTLQYLALGVILVASIYIFFINIRLHKKDTAPNKFAPIFILISIGAFLYSFVVLIAMLAFRKGIGF